MGLRKNGGARGSGVASRHAYSTPKRPGTRSRNQAARAAGRTRKPAWLRAFSVRGCTSGACAVWNVQDSASAALGSPRDDPLPRRGVGAAVLPQKSAANSRRAHTGHSTTTWLSRSPSASSPSRWAHQPRPSPWRSARWHSAQTSGVGFRDPVGHLVHSSEQCRGSAAGTLRGFNSRRLHLLTRDAIRPQVRSVAAGYSPAGGCRRALGRSPRLRSGRPVPPSFAPPAPARRRARRVRG